MTPATSMSPVDISTYEIIDEYTKPHPFQIKFIMENLDVINPFELSQSPIGLKLLLKADPDLVDWNGVSVNPSKTAIRMLRANPENINWEMLSSNYNPKAMQLLQKRLYKANLWRLSCNPAAINILKANPHLIDWKSLSANTNPAAMAILKTNPNKIDWEVASANPAMIKLLQDNPDKLYWRSLAENHNPIAYQMYLDHKIGMGDLKKLSSNPEAITLLQKHSTDVCLRGLSSNIAGIGLLEMYSIYAIDWKQLSGNPGALKLLQQNPEMIDPVYFTRARFRIYNFKAIRKLREPINREIIEYLYHPSRIQKWIEAGNDIEDYLP